MSARITDAVNDSGFAILRNHLPEDSSLAAFSQIGTVLRLPRVADVQVLAPRSEIESYPNTYSGNYGWSEFPLHTDLSHWHVLGREGLALGRVCIRGKMPLPLQDKSNQKVRPSLCGALSRSRGIHPSAEQPSGSFVCAITPCHGHVRISDVLI